MERRLLVSIRGFTIVELLVVIVLIAVLSAVTVVAYNGIQGRARVAATDLERSAIDKGIESFRTLNNNNVPISQDDLRSVGLSTVVDKITIGSGVTTPWNPTNTPQGRYRLFATNFTYAQNGCTQGVSGQTHCGYTTHDMQFYWWDYQKNVWMGRREIRYEPSDISTRIIGPEELEYSEASNNWMGTPCNLEFVEQCSPV